LSWSHPLLGTSILLAQPNMYPWTHRVYIGAKSDGVIMLPYCFIPQSFFIKTEKVGPSATSLCLFTIYTVFAPKYSYLDLIMCFTITFLLRNKIRQITQFLSDNKSAGISDKVHYNSKYSLIQTHHWLYTAPHNMEHKLQCCLSHVNFVLISSEWEQDMWET
jgi:hypothetical protein